MGIWTDKKIEKLKQLWEKGVPTAEIGKRLDFSKNAIVGKVHRLGLSNRNSPIKAPSEKIEKVKKTPAKKTAEISTSQKKAKTAQRSLFNEKELKTRGSVIKSESPKIPSSPKSPSKQSAVEGVSISELTADRCCWPVDDGNSDTFRFCGKKVFKNKPYCLEHCALAYTTTSSPAERKEERKSSKE